jgi:hypothetical protein
MKYAVQMGSVVMLYISTFIKIGSGSGSAVGIVTAYGLDD